VFKLAHWCCVSPRGIYHDFRADYAYLPQLATMLNAHPNGFTFGQAGVSRDVVMGWYRDGYLVPMRKS
jgi:hypothetical protein